MGIVNRVQQRRRKRLSLPGDVERGAVIHGRAHDGQSDSHIDAAFKTDELHRRMALIVVHTDDRVMLIVVYRLVDASIRRMRAGDIQAF